MARGERLGQVRAWKLFLMLPRMLLSRPPRGGEVPKKKLQDRFAAFARGEWAQLVEASLATIEGTISNQASAERPEGRVESPG